MINVCRMKICWGILPNKQRQKRMTETFYLASYDKKVKIIAKAWAAMNSRELC